jgi:hypothetical protein
MYCAPFGHADLVNEQCPSNFGCRFVWFAVSIADGDFN